MENFKDSLKILCSESFTSVSAPIQYAAIEAYKGDHSKYLNAVKKILSFTAEYVYENLKSNVINITKPEGGFYLLPEFNNAKLIYYGVIELDKDPTTSTGFKWTSGQGPNYPVLIGTEAQVLVTVGNEPPISKLLPSFR